MKTMEDKEMEIKDQAIDTQNEAENSTENAPEVEEAALSLTLIHI